MERRNQRTLAGPIQLPQPTEPHQRPAMRADEALLAYAFLQECERFPKKVALAAGPDQRIVAGGFDPIDLAQAQHRSAPRRRHHDTVIAPGRLGRLQSFGRVPLFYYLLHIPAIHIVALAVTFLREGTVHPEWYASAPFTSVPAEHRWGLPLLYLVWAVVVALLYAPCRWYSTVKGQRQRWLRYL